MAGAFVLPASQGALHWNTFRASLFGATRLDCRIALILAGAAFIALSTGHTGLPRQLAKFWGA